MKIARTSPLTGETNTLDLPIDRRSFHRWLNGEPVQHCFPTSTPTSETRA